MNIEIAPRNKWIIDSSFDEAMMYCLFLEIDGKKGWRLPTDEEAGLLVDIVDPDNDFAKGEIPPELEEFNDYWFDDHQWGFWTQSDIDGGVGNSGKSYYEMSQDITLIPVRDI